MDKKEKQIDENELRKLLADPRRWRVAAKILSERLRDKGLQKKFVEAALGEKQPTIHRFLAGDPTPKKFFAKLGKIKKLIQVDLELDLEDLQWPGNLHLCIDWVECCTLHFHAEGDYAVPYPMDPRTHPSQNVCKWCGHDLASKCPECDEPICDGPYCPSCRLRYVAGEPDELHGLRGRQLAEACEKRNAANRAAMEHLNTNLRS
jgi:hypothetical protein